MKKLVIYLIFLSLHSASFSQIMSELDEVYPFHGEFAAIKKANQWAFIDKKGKKIIDYRTDVLLTNNLNSLNQKISYPVFNDGRCLIRKLIDDIFYYGFINENGAEIIKPQFLNATNFSNGYAIVVISSKDFIGFNAVLKMPIVSNNIEEYIIDTKGELVKYLYNPRKNVPANYKNGLPNIESKFVAPKMVAVKTKNKNWEIHEF